VNGRSKNVLFLYYYTKVEPVCPNLTNKYNKFRRSLFDQIVKIFVRFDYGYIIKVNFEPTYIGKSIGYTL